MRALQVIAGPAARQHLLEHGLQPEHVHTMAGASGGPKWLALFGLDQYLFGEFFQQRTTALQVVGSSAGAWRFACFAQKDPVAASRRFAEGYIRARFPRGLSRRNVTAASRDLLAQVLDSDCAGEEILANPIVRLNVIVARSRGLCAANQPGLQAAGLGLAAGLNALHRRTLGLFFERLVLHADPVSPLLHLTDLPGRHVPLHQDNLAEAILASGSIPLVLDPVRDLPGLGPGHYVDGGITDYHFAVPLLAPDATDGLVLFPHFYGHTIPGWFDKALPWRRGQGPHRDRMIILCPTPEWVDSLPYSKIPDRKDFARLDDAERERYWRTTVERSWQLSDELAGLVDGSRPWHDYLT